MGSPHLGGLSPAATIVIGIFVGLLSTSIQSIGLTLQRKSHQLEDEKEDELIRRPPYRRRRWQIGMFIFIVANLVGSTIQITTLPLPVLSTLQASGLVFNTLCASIILHEPFNRWSLVGTALVAGGAVLIALYGAIPEPSHNLAQHIELLERRQFILWMIGTFILMAAILFAIFLINRLHPHGQPPVLRLSRGFAFGALSSILSAHSLLVAKSAVELLVRTIVDHRNQFDRWQSWIILVLLIFFALSQLYFLHRGLKLVSTSVLYPFVFCIYNIIAILDGLIYFRQTSRLPPLHGALIAIGTVILLSGVLALSWRLDEEKYSAPPPEAHSLLTPGMGIVEDTTTDDEGGNDTDYDYDLDSDKSSLAAADEESLLDMDTNGTSTERTPLLRNGSSHALKRTPTAQHNKILRITKQRRARFAAPPRRQSSHASQIWDELQDAPPPLPTSRPPSSAGGLTSHPRDWTPSPTTRYPRRASTQGLDLAAGASASRLSKGHSRSRARTLGTAGPAGTQQQTWRERERERRRREAWGGVGGFGPPRRSASTPLAQSAAAASRSERRRRASGVFGGGDGGGDYRDGATGSAANVDSRGRRDGSWAGWLAGWFTRQRGDGGGTGDDGANDEGNSQRAAEGSGGTS